MLFTVLRPARNLLWCTAKVARSYVYALSGVCRFMWKGAQVYLFRGVLLKTPDIVYLPFLSHASASTNVINGYIRSRVFVGCLLVHRASFSLLCELALLWCRLHWWSLRFLCGDGGPLRFCLFWFSRARTALLV